MSDTHSTAADPGDKKPKQIDFTIDRQSFEVPKQPLTGALLRDLAEPNIGPDRDLYLEAKGDKEDKLIELSQEVQLKDGMHFFTAPASIQPGHAA